MLDVSQLYGPSQPVTQIALLLLLALGVTQPLTEMTTRRCFFYSSPCIIRIIKSRRMRWAGHVARMGEKRNVYRLLVESQMERDH
jgi:hypothetical protein